jgi:Reverse transcriptase (RNA-dependent DNA polymerase)
MVVNKALYGLRSSGHCWHEIFAGILKSTGFFQSRGEQDIWMRRNGDWYEYIGLYVDGLAIVAENPVEIVHTLEMDHGLKIKGTGSLKLHLGCELYFGQRSYIDNMLDNYERMFGEKPREYSSPLEKGDHPEIDDSDLLDPGDVPKYQSLIGSVQWSMSLGRFDIQTAAMNMSHFRISPRKGHLDTYKSIRMVQSGFELLNLILQSVLLLSIIGCTLSMEMYMKTCQHLWERMSYLQIMLTQIYTMILLLVMQ